MRVKQPESYLTDALKGTSPLLLRDKNEAQKDPQFNVKSPGVLFKQEIKSNGSTVTYQNKVIDMQNKVKSQVSRNTVSIITNTERLISKKSINAPLSSGTNLLHV